jgi:hypothetical protein
MSCGALGEMVGTSSKSYSKKILLIAHCYICIPTLSTVLSQRSTYDTICPPDFRLYFIVISRELTTLSVND